MSKSDSSIIKPQLSTIQTPKMAFVIDWLDTMGGAETMLLVLHEMYPEAPIYTSVYDKKRSLVTATCVPATCSGYCPHLFATNMCCGQFLERTLFGSLI